VYVLPFSKTSDESRCGQDPISPLLLIVRPAPIKAYHFEGCPIFMTLPPTHIERAASPATAPPTLREIAPRRRQTPALNGEIKTSWRFSPNANLNLYYINNRVAVISAKNHKRRRRKRQSVTAKREKSQTPKVLTAMLTLPDLT